MTKQEFREDLFNSMIVTSGSINISAKKKVETLVSNIDRYKEVSHHFPNPGLKWWFVAVIHEMECSQNFNRHLHNGDRLINRTINVPAGRPIKGIPPFTFTESAIDALELKGADKITDWSIGNILYFLEGYNGYGYEKYHHINSPYLWSGTNHYTKGKYIADGKWDENAVSKQVGVAILLKYIIV